MTDKWIRTINKAWVHFFTANVHHHCLKHTLKTFKLSVTKQQHQEHNVRSYWVSVFVLAAWSSVFDIPSYPSYRRHCPCGHVIHILPQVATKDCKICGVMYSHSSIDHVCSIDHTTEHGLHLHLTKYVNHSTKTFSLFSPSQPGPVAVLQGTANTNEVLTALPLYTRSRLIYWFPTILIQCHLPGDSQILI